MDVDPKPVLLASVALVVRHGSTSLEKCLHTFLVASTGCEGPGARRTGMVRSPSCCGRKDSVGPAPATIAQRPCFARAAKRLKHRGNLIDRHAGESRELLTVHRQDPQRGDDLVS